MTEKWNEEDDDLLAELLCKLHNTCDDPELLQFSSTLVDEYVALIRTREPARVELLEMLRLSDGDEDNLDVNRAMALVRQHPFLATQAYHGRTLFSHFLRAGVGRGILKELVRLWPRDDEFQENSTDWIANGFRRPPNPVTDAFLYAQDTATASFIIRKLPEYACLGHDYYEEDDDDWNNQIPPSAYFLARCIGSVPTEEGYGDYARRNIIDNPAQIMEKILALRPEIWPKIWEEGLFYNLLQEAAHGIYAGNVRFHALIQKILGRHKAPPKFDIKKDYAVQLKVVLTRLTTWHCEEDSEFPALLDCLPRMPALRTLQCPVIPHVGPNDPFFLALQSCPRLCELTLWPGYEYDDAANSIRVIWLTSRILEAKPAIESLSLDHTRDASPRPFRNLFKQIQLSPNLTELALSGSSWGTDGIVAILNDNRLQSLSLMDGYGGDEATVGKLSPIAEAIKTNTSLKSFCYDSSMHSDGSLDLLVEALRDHNVTLESAFLGYPDGMFTEPDDQPYGDKFHYYTLLNRCGRATIRGDNASRDDLIRSLCSAVELKPDDVVDERFRWRNGHHSVLYGLLREKPSLWMTDTEF